jgi:hypothetical protein
MEKAQENKKKVDLEENYNKGKNKKNLKSVSSSKHALQIIDSVDIELGKDSFEIGNNLEVCLAHDRSRRGGGLNMPSSSVGSGVEAEGDSLIDEGRLSDVGDKKGKEVVVDKEPTRKWGKHPRKEVTQ